LQLKHHNKNCASKRYPNCRKIRGQLESYEETEQTFVVIHNKSIVATFFVHKR
jgi:hypothetical protein